MASEVRLHVQSVGHWQEYGAAGPQCVRAPFGAGGPGAGGPGPAEDVAWPALHTFHCGPPFSYVENTSLHTRVIRQSSHMCRLV